MTALAMILGMLPMALGLGEGGEQNAPLGRAVIGGLLVATFIDAVHRAGDLLAAAQGAADQARHGEELRSGGARGGAGDDEAGAEEARAGAETAPKRQGEGQERAAEAREMTHNPPQGTEPHPARLLYVGGALLVVLPALVVGGLALAAPPSDPA